MAELSRAAQAAVRTSALLRCPTTRCLSASTTPSRRPISTTAALFAPDDTDRPNRPYSMPRFGGSQRQQSPSTFAGWANPSARRGPTSTQVQNGEVKKPDMAAYERPDPLMPGGLEDGNNFSDGIEFDLNPNPTMDDLDKSNAPPPPKPTMRLVPRIGRTIHVARNIDLARALKLLAVQVAQNRLRQDFQYQQRHERPGMKRKRLKMERWQKKFKRGFKACVGRVRELTKQGW
ncbi:hypothetical protein F4780DRAFT_635958 [Xylariomycetidae sp. FL0641]|nr:hypothetical protein F4780DRAFT_635958 [Xylariomycetidae sp. FL0641]